MASVTVIVVTFDSEGVIAACLAGIPAECPVHVVDNASEDGTLACIAALDRPRLRATQMPWNEGFGRACNHALREVATSQALLLNPDAAITPAALARLSANLAATSDVAIMAPRVIETGPAPSPAPAAEPASSGAAEPGRRTGGADPVRWAGAPERRQEATLLDVPEVPAACMLVDMERLHQIGFFDESFFLYYEDSDLCWRARAAGFRVCIAVDEVATHRSGDSSSALRTGDLLRERLLGQSYAHFTAKHHPHPRRRVARKALGHLSGGLGSLLAGRVTRARKRFARMRGILEYVLIGPQALWANRLAERTRDSAPPEGSRRRA
jgi:GT2 family glycosyltransferase